MNLILWIVASVLAVAFLAAGALKLTQPKSVLLEKGLTWTEDYSPGAIKLIGAVEALGAIGLVLPRLLDIAPVLVAWAALGLALMMAGAVVVHLRSGEQKEAVPALVLGLLAAFVATGRF